MKKKLSIILLSVLTTLLLVGATGCSQPQKTHVCLNDAFGAVQNLQKLDSDKPHDIVAEMEKWKEDRPQNAPFVKTYEMTYDYTLPESATITLGQNVYVSICTYSAKLTYKENQIVLSKDENGVANSVFEVRECTLNSCFASMMPAIKLTEAYVIMGYEYAISRGETSFQLPAGNYAMMHSFSLESYINAGKLTFENPANTVICFNNTLENTLNNALSSEVSILKNKGITVYLECLEDEPASTTHSCVYTNRVEPLPLDQKTFDLLSAEFEQHTLSESEAVSSVNFQYAFLTEDIYGDAMVTVPQGLYIGICKNGFEFNVPKTENLYVFDCVPHVCLYTQLTGVTPIWQEGLDILYANAQAAEIDFVLPSGSYALMEDVDCTKFPNLFASEAEYLLCYNGHTLTGVEMPRETCVVCDCTQSIEEEGLLTHACTKISNHITPLLITQPVLELLVNDQGELMLPEGVLEIALALPADFEIGATLTIPKGVKLSLCLNGYTLSGSQSLAEYGDSPYLFKVEYGAELYICDCSVEKTGALLSVTEEMLMQNNNPENSDSFSSSIAMHASPIYNLGDTVLDGVKLQGATGAHNAGHLYIENSDINGFYVGVMLNEANAYDDPLHSYKPSVETTDSEISGILAGIIKLGGRVDLDDTVINASVAGIVSDKDLLEINKNSYKGDITLSDVTVNLTLVYPEAEDVLLEMIQELGVMAGIVADSDIAIEGNFAVNVDEIFLEPYIPKDSNQIKKMEIAEFFLGTNAHFEIDENAVLTDEYRVYFENTVTEDFVLSNKDLSENFILMEGLVGLVNEKEEYVILASSSCGFMNNAVVSIAEVGFEGYVRLDFYCRFDANEKEELFLSNSDSRVIFNVADEKIKIHPSEMKPLGDNTYYYSVDFYAKDYQERIFVQFTNGKYTWTGKMALSVEDFLEESLLNLEKSLQEVDSVLADTTATETAIATAEANKKELIAYKNAVLSMLNYCNVTTKYFYGAEYEALDKTFAQQEVEIIVDETTQESSEQKVWKETSVADAMAAVTAETLKSFAPKVKEGSVLPQNVKFNGASLILNSGTFIRFYFTATQEVMQNLTVTINGEVVTPTLHSTGGNIYYVQVENLSALQLKTTYDMTITDGESEYTISYGVFSYMYGVLNNPQADKELVLVAKAMWVLADEADKTARILSGQAMSNDEVKNNENA